MEAHMGRSERFKAGDPPSRKVRLCQVNGPKPLVSDVPIADVPANQVKDVLSSVALADQSA
jgi:hypothetical protein